MTSQKTAPEIRSLDAAEIDQTAGGLRDRYEVLRLLLRLIASQGRPQV